MPRSGYLPLLALLSTLAATAGATTVLAVRTEDRVVLAADSRVQVVGGPQSGARTGCKVHLTRNIVWSHAGYYANPSTGFDVVALAGRVFAQPGAFEARLQQLAAAVPAPLQRALLALREADPKAYDEDVAAPLKLVAVTLEDGVPTLAVLQFARTDAGRIAAGLYRCPGDCPTGTQYVSAGNHQQADRLVQSAPAYFAQPGWLDGMRGLLDAEASLHPSQVSPPYTVVAITRAGVEWLDRGSCAQP